MNRSIVNFIRIASVLLISNQLVGCGGSDGSSTSTTSTGQFVDAPVNGLNYICSITDVAGSETTGTTEGNGNFQYKPGARCLFKIGNVSLGEAVAVGSDGIVTPYDVVSASRASDSNDRAIAVAQLLQSLDSGVESNKITIPASVREALRQVAATNVAAVGAVLSQQDLEGLVKAAGKSSLVLPGIAKTALTSYLTSAGISLTSGSSPMLYKGVNLSGGEWGSGTVPGSVPQTYSWPTTADITYFNSLGMNVIRLPILWERLQPSLSGDFDTTYFNSLKDVVSKVTTAGMSAVIDVHNYAHYPLGNAAVDGQPNYIGGSSGPTNDQFGNLWTRLAQDPAFKSNNLVIFNIMNEPTYMPTTTWLSAANAAITAIRATGANNLLLVPGNCWTGGWSWSGSTIYQCDAPNDNATQMLKIVDSGNNYAFDIHQYLDANYSGTGGQECTHDGAQALAGVTSWLKANKKRAFLGEFAGINSSACQTSVTNMLNFMNANPGNKSTDGTITGGWIGWTWWGAGPMYYYTYNGDGFYLEPANWSWSWSNSANQMVWTTPQPPVDQPQVKWLKPFLQ